MRGRRSYGDGGDGGGISSLPKWNENFRIINIVRDRRLHVNFVKLYHFNNKGHKYSIMDENMYT